MKDPEISDMPNENAENLNAATQEELNNTAENTQTENPAPDEATQIENLKAELAAEKDKYLRLYSEFENYKRRTSKERMDLLLTANKETIIAMLPVLDDFDRAQKSLEGTTDVGAVKEGVALVHNKLRNILQNKGLKEMETNGQVFDSDLHEAITNIPAPSEDMVGKVVDSLEKGYYLNDKVIRYAKVVVGS